MNATEILQDYLDRLSDAVMRGDFATYAKGVAIPFTLLTTEKEISVTSIDSLREGFQAYHRMLISQHATDMIRLVEKAEIQSPEWIAGRYTTNILSNSRRTFDPFSSDIFLFCDGGVWQSVWISNGMKNTQWPIHLPELTHKHYPTLESATEERSDNAQN